MIGLGSAASDRAWEARLAAEQEHHDALRCGECGELYDCDLVSWCSRTGDWECEDCQDYYHGGDAS